MAAVRVPPSSVAAALAGGTELHAYRDDERLRKAERLRVREEFLETREHGCRRTSTHFVVYARANQREYNRLGMTASTRVGSATARNWWKRRIREIFRRNKRAIAAGFDFVVIVKSSADRASYDALREELLGVLEQCAEAAEQ